MLAEIFSYDRQIFERGVSQGIERGKFEMVKAMLNSEVSIDDVSKFSGLSLDEIQQIAV